MHVSEVKILPDILSNQWLPLQNFHSRIVLVCKWSLALKLDNYAYSLNYERWTSDLRIQFRDLRTSSNWAGLKSARHCLSGQDPTFIYGNRIQGRWQRPVGTHDCLQRSKNWSSFVAQSKRWICQCQSAFPSFKGQPVWLLGQTYWMMHGQWRRWL